MVSSPGARSAERPPEGNDIEASGRRALDGIDRVLAGRPHADGHLLSAVIVELCRIRDVLVDRRRNGDLSRAAEERLARLNSVLSMVMSTQFPLGGIRWDEFARSRTWLEDLLAEL